MDISQNFVAFSEYSRPSSPFDEVFVLHQAPFGNFSFSVQRITSLMSIEATENERVEYVCIFGTAPIALFLQSLHRACAF